MIDDLLCGDCLELMNFIPDNSVDMVLCDLPYGTTQNKWDFCIDTTLLWHQYKRVCKPNAAIVLFAQTPFDKVLGCSNLEMLKYEWIWEKSRSTGFLNSKKMPLKAHENILVFYKDLPVYNPQMRTGFKPYTCKQGSHGKNYGKKIDEVVSISNGERYPISILPVTNSTGEHPTQKPVPLCEYLIKTYTNEHMLVLDNTMGSGTTGVACINTNRHFFGIERDPAIFDIAVKRIADAKKTPVQPELI